MKKEPKNKDGRHQFKWMTYRGNKIRVDKNIAPLIAKMWEIGIATTNSCHAMCDLNCGHKYVKAVDKDGEYMKPVPTPNCHNSMWVCFESVKDLELFLNVVMDYYDKHMYELIGGDRFISGSRWGKNLLKNTWSYSFLNSNLGVKGHWGRPIFNGKRSTQEMWIDDDCEKNESRIQPQVTFPRIHLDYIMKKFEAWNEST